MRRRAVLSGAGIGMLHDHQPEELGIYAIYLPRQHQALALRLLVDFWRRALRGRRRRGMRAKSRWGAGEGPKTVGLRSSFRTC